MSYTLKKGQPPFEVVDGPMTGQSFVPGQEYEDKEIPASEKGRFEKVRKTAAKPAKAKESLKNA